MEELSEIIKIAFAALRANKMRSVLTMLGVIIGVSSVILLVSIGSGLQTYITGQLEDLGAKNLFVIPGHFELAPGGGQGGGGMPGPGAAAPPRRARGHAAGRRAPRGNAPHPQPAGRGYETWK